MVPTLIITPTSFYYTLAGWLAGWLARKLLGDQLLLDALTIMIALFVCSDGRAIL